MKLFDFLKNRKVKMQSKKLIIFKRKVCGSERDEQRITYTYQPIKFSTIEEVITSTPQGTKIVFGCN